MTENKVIEEKEKDLLFFNEAVEYFNKFEKSDFIFSQNSENLSQNQLRDQMLNELNNLREIIINHPDLKLRNLNKEDRKEYSEFMKYYSICPVCKDPLHWANLKKLYFDEANSEIKKQLLDLMKFKNKKLDKLSLDFGIPCCKCFKNLFQKEKKH